MNIDWDLVIKIGIPLVTLFLGRFLDQILTKRPKLISYLGHVSSFILNNPQNKTQVYTHAIVIRNAGREAANNVRIGHNFLPPDYQIFPSVPHSVVNPPTGGSEIVIEKLVPSEQLTISYLYFPPLTWDRINSYTKSDEGFAKILNVIPTPQPPRLVIALFWFFVFVGVVTLFYMVAQFLR
jgi:hypothetical protein